MASNEIAVAGNDLDQNPDFLKCLKWGIDEALFVQMTLGDDRAIRQTWIAGRKAWDRDEAAAVAPRRP